MQVLRRKAIYSHGLEPQVMDGMRSTKAHPNPKRHSWASLRSWVSDDGSLGSRLSLGTSESLDATTISTSSRPGSFCHSLEPGSPSLVVDAGHADFVKLQQSLARLTSKTGASRANVLRQSLLAFLRLQLWPDVPQQPELSFRLAVLEAWWTRLLRELQGVGVSQPPARADLAAFYEGISGLMTRKEWLSVPDKYAELLKATFNLVVGKISMASIPVALGAFAGKILAYVFFYCEDVARTLIEHLQPRQSVVTRLLSVWRNGRSKDLPSRRNIEILRSIFPKHVGTLVGDFRVSRSRMQGAEDPSSIKGPWLRHWSVSSPLFASFFLHYYSLLAGFFPPDSNAWAEAYVCAPGLVHLQAAIVSYFDNIVVGSKPIRVDQLRILGAFREIVHNSATCSPHFNVFILHLDHILQCVAASTSVYETAHCLRLCDLVEEWFSCVNLGETEVSMPERQRSVNSQFWTSALIRMIESDKTQTQIRALSLLFNALNFFVDTSYDDDEQPLYLEPVELSPSSRLTDFILSPQCWTRLFCHWNPLVRSYYQRLVCFRFSCAPCYRIKETVNMRLSETYGRCVRVSEGFFTQPDATASLPMPHRSFDIMGNPASSLCPIKEMRRVHQFDIFDLAAYYGGDDPTSFLEKGHKPPIMDHISIENGTPSTIYSAKSPINAPAEKKRWSLFRKKDKSVTRNQNSPQCMYLDFKSVPRPPALTESRLEIRRPAFRFCLQEAPFKPFHRAQLSQPRIPFGSPIKPITTMSSPNHVRSSLDTIYWTYGGKSLAEWEQVVCQCETFLRDQKNAEIPFMVAEVPFRAHG